MQIELQNLLRELEVFGKSNDLEVNTRQQKMLNITTDTGMFLSLQIQACKAKRILEIGTSNGYSTIWLASAAAKVDGHVTTIEIQNHKIEKAKANFNRSGLQHKIQLIHLDAGIFLKSAELNSFDFIFLDSDREQYTGWWSELIRVLVPGGLLIVDNAISHENELIGFRHLVEKENFESAVVPIGNGELLVLKPLQ
jgi:predicted O-methyltransferase YrrM